ncbi:MAG: PQQ-binding-like beta-propeller repeat protein [Verrucomicrobiota bacterium]
MIRLTLIFLLAALTTTQAADWPWWRGPDNNGIAPGDQTPPTEFSDSKNVKWTAPIQGRGHGSATVVGDRVYIVAAELETETQSVICLNRETGEQIWKSEVHKGGFPKKFNKKSSQASGTPAFDRERIFINFWNDGTIHTTALDLEGKKLWQQKITDYVIHQNYAASPAIHEDLVIVAADNKGGSGMIKALKREDGSEVWKVDRPKMPNYPSPVILDVAGRLQLLMTGCELVTSLNPSTGEKLWEIEGATTECVTTTVTDGQHIYTSGGYPKNHVAAVAADGSGKVVWETKERVYVPSMLCKDGYLYAVMDAGVAVCWKSDTGEEIWKERLGGTFSGSPTMVGDLIYVGNESGDVFVYRADPKKFEIVAKNQLGDEVYSTPTICGGELFLRVAKNEGGERKEVLYCISK